MNRSEARALTKTIAPPETVWWLQWHLRRARAEMYGRKDEFLKAHREFRDADQYVDALKLVVSRTEEQE